MSQTPVAIANELQRLRVENIRLSAEHQRSTTALDDTEELMQWATEEILALRAQLRRRDQTIQALRIQFKERGITHD